MTARACWLAVYAFACVASLLAGWLKDHAEKRVKDDPAPPGDAS